VRAVTSARARRALVTARDKELHVEALEGKRHHGGSFSCGVESLDAYLKARASQDTRRKANAVFVLIGAADARTVLGYFTLCASSVAPGVIPEAARKHLPRYPQPRFTPHTPSMNSLAALARCPGSDPDRPAHGDSSRRRPTHPLRDLT
jgi:hypothetical protein